MEHSPPHPLSRKRKASQSSPVQDHRCVLQDDVPPDRALLHDPPSPPPVDPSPLYAVDEGAARGTKRPRVSIVAPDPRARARRLTPPRKRSPPRPTSQPQPPPPHDLAHPYHHHHHPTPQEQQYLLRRRPSLPTTNGSLLSPLAESPASSSPITASPHVYVPPLLPTITRDTLRELDLEAILKNPQLRHDLLFDPGLQFRPTASRRKQLITDRYWAAVLREIEHNCTCTAWDTTGVMLSCGCRTTPETSRRKDGTLPKRTRPPTPPPWSNRYYTAYLDAAADPRLDDALEAETPKNREEEQQSTFQISVPSRIRPMLHEIIAVLKCVIVPAPLPSSHASSSSSSSSTNAPPRLLPSASASDAQNLLTHFDPSLIEQELRRGIFEPAGLFALVGDTLKRHCAPMRDKQVDAMVTVARGSEGSVTRRAVTTIRMCFEILELMKLDIANHQLQHLRPFLASSTPEFELRVFIERCRRNLASPRIAREWLQRSWDNIKTSPMLADLNKMTVAVHVPTVPPPRRTLVQLSLIDMITRLVFNPPPASFASPNFGYPETLYLDMARVALLAADAADLTALYMLLMLWRQLVFWTPGSGDNKGEAVKSEIVFPRYARATPRLEDWEVDRVKREIWEVGPRRIGHCFFFIGADSADDVAENRAKWRQAMQNVALQVAMRAEEARGCTATTSGAAAAAGAGVSDITLRRPPSQEALGLMSGWIQSHMRRDSALAGRLRELLRQEVAHTVTRLTFPAAGGLGSNNETVPGSDGMKTSGAATATAGGGGAGCKLIPGSGGGTAGLEPLMPEIRHLAQRLAKLVLVNMRVYGGLYDAEGFLTDKIKVESC